ncbi:MAG: DUF4105 domain-containing protein [Flavobacteriales bacterium]
MKKILLLCVGILLMMEIKSQQIEASDNARFTLLTCTSGADLYSIFGHTAIRYEDTIAGVPIDWVYNYGTFDGFDPGFYLKFAQGKLDYRLSKTEFAGFQFQYIQEGRGIFSQEMLIEPNDKRRMLRALEENYKPENRYYRYDFFYDNCATRVRDMLVKTPSQKVDLTYTYAHSYTFREAIQRYLDHMPWSDFGIDLALGIPCDKEMQKGDPCFLPDSLMNEMHFATYGDGVLMGRTEEMLPKDYDLSDHSFFTPMVVFSIFMVLQLFWGMLRMRAGMPVVVTDRVLLLVTGLIGVVVFFLWFLTDHTTTKWNLNLLWANPINLYLAFASLNKKWIQSYFKILTGILLIIIAGWFFIPQRLHLATLPMIIGLLFITLRQLRPTMFGGKKRVQV